MIRSIQKEGNIKKKTAGGGNRERGRNSEREKDRKREIERERKKERTNERDREREREREREKKKRENAIVCYVPGKVDRCFFSWPQKYPYPFLQINK